MSTGCSVTKDWVVSTAQNLAATAVDKQLEKFNEKYLAPRLEKVEADLGHKIDKDDNGVFDPEEVKTAIKEEVSTAAADLTKALTEQSDKSLNERLKDVATKSDSIWNLIYLVGIYLLSKLGMKVGPKGIQSLKSVLNDRRTKKLNEGLDKVDL
jgi:hypothetical protein